jgi:putative transposase
MKKRFSEEQIIGFPKEAEAGVPVKELCRKHGFSDASFYTWRSKYGGLEVPDAKRLKPLEQENARLKKLLAESMLDKEALEAALRKNVWSAPVLQAPDIGCGKASPHKCIRPVDGRSASWP